MLALGDVRAVPVGRRRLGHVEGDPQSEQLVEIAEIVGLAEMMAQLPTGSEAAGHG